MKHALKHTRPALSAVLFGWLALPAWAHEGHGLPGLSHWHCTDVLGFVVVAALAAAALWFNGDK